MMPTNRALAVALLLSLLFPGVMAAGIIDDIYSISTNHFVLGGQDAQGKTWGATSYNVTFNSTPAYVKFGLYSLNINYSCATILNPQMWETTNTSYLNMTVGGGDYTVDFWYYPRAPMNSQNTIVNAASNKTWSPLLIAHLNASNTMAFYSGTNNLAFDICYNMSMGEVDFYTWNHYAVVKNGSNYKGYKNGVLRGTCTSGTGWNNSATYNWSIGGQRVNGFNYSINGILDEVRISNKSRWLSNFTPQTTEYGTPAIWNYTTPGTFTYCSPDVTALNLYISGAGGSGMAGYCSGVANYAAGNGGSAGESGNYSLISVLPNTCYNVTIGIRGNGTAPSSRTSNAGSNSIALSKIMNGGAGGTLMAQDTDSAKSGGSGDITNYLTLSKLAIDAGASMGGIGGTGYGAGGGGGGHFGTTPCVADYSGSGANGTVVLFLPGAYGENTPNFTASPLSGTPGTTVVFTDTSTIRETGGLSYTWDWGDGTAQSTSQSPQVTHIYGISGSFSPSLTITGNVTRLTTIRENYILITGNTATVWYSPANVRFTVLDWLGNNVVGATVNATYVETTLPTATNWLTNVYGVNAAIADEMLSSATVMEGITDDTGGLVFTMHPSLKYNITVTNASSTTSVSIYPKEQDYNIWLPKPSVNNTYAQIGYNLTFWEPNASYYTMGATYQDNSSLTQRVTFYVNGSNGTLINYTTLINPGTSLLNITKTIPNTRGESFYYGVNVVRSEPAGKGNISASRGVTSKGASGVMVDLRLPSATYYPWIALFLLFLITSLASKGNVRFMAIIIPIMATIFWWFGWMTFSYTAAVVPFACLLGAIFYMKGSLRENYGVGGSGSMLVNIVVFMIILQMMIGFINGIGVFNQAGTMNPSNEFSNVDLLTIQNGTQNFGGINDPIQGAQNYAAIGWATLKIGLDMIGAVFIVGVYLIEMFPYVPREFFLIIQGGIYILYVFFIMKLVGKVGSEVDL